MMSTIFLPTLFDLYIMKSKKNRLDYTDQLTESFDLIIMIEML